MLIRGYTFLVLFASIHNVVSTQQPIDRKSLVERHKVVVTKFDSLSSLTVGNGRFAFTVDITGLQTFPEAYKKGIPLGTESEWGWHSFIDTAGYKFEETLKEYSFNNRKATYSVQWDEPERKKNAADWFRQNPHRLQLGNLGFELIKKDGSVATINDIQNIRQELNPWTGQIKSHFTIENIPVDVSTICDFNSDILGAKISSPLISEGRLKVQLIFPYPTGAWTDEGTNYTKHEKHFSSIIQSEKTNAIVKHKLDTTQYFIAFRWNGQASFNERNSHSFFLTPATGKDSFEFTVLFTNRKLQALPSLAYGAVESRSKIGWSSFWSRGGAVDFSGNIDPRAFELERRIILSQYLTKVQCAGKQPPQETGLTYNSWFGRPHMEMHWWHGVHFALWGRTELLEESLAWYGSAFKKAKSIAQRQGFEGIRWQKMTDPSANEGPSSIGSFLIWQQPHFIYLAELIYQEKKNTGTLNKYKDLLFATADFMASYAFYDVKNDRYILGKGMIPAQERFKPEETFNAPFELSYWYWALSTAQKWRERLQLSRNKKWDEVLLKLSRLPQKDGVYLAAENAPDSYARAEYKTDHPMVMGVYGMLPHTKMIDTAIMRKTFNLVWDVWRWEETWGWDFPMVAMTATRLGLPERAIDALFMPVTTNTYLVNGHNYQNERLRMYMPGNGGLLTAVALMLAGYNGCTTNMPGIPNNGKWKVRWEGLNRMP